MDFFDQIMAYSFLKSGSLELLLNNMPQRSTAPRGKSVGLASQTKVASVPLLVTALTKQQLRRTTALGSKRRSLLSLDLWTKFSQTLRTSEKWREERSLISL